MTDTIQPRGFEAVTQYLSHHHNDYHEMVVGNLISISNLTHTSLDTVIDEFDRQKAQLQQLGDFDVTSFDAFTQSVYRDPDATVVAVDFTQPKRVPNFFAMLNQAHAQFQAPGVSVFEATGEALTLKVSAHQVEIQVQDPAVAAYIRQVVATGYTA